MFDIIFILNTMWSKNGAVGGFYYDFFCVIELYCKCSIKCLSETVSAWIPNPNFMRKEVILSWTGC